MSRNRWFILIIVIVLVAAGALVVKSIMDRNSATTAATQQGLANLEIRSILQVSCEQQGNSEAMCRDLVADLMVELESAIDACWEEYGEQSDAWRGCLRERGVL